MNETETAAAAILEAPAAAAPPPGPVAKVLKFLSIDEIAAIQDTEYDVIETPEWGEGTAIRVGSLDAQQMLDFVEANEGPAKKTAGIRLIIKSLVDESGTRIGNDRHIAMLKTKSAKVIERIAVRILEMNGMSKPSREKLGNASGEAKDGASPTV